jgi:hypothetical protein
MLQTPLIFDRQGQTAIYHFSENPMLHNIDLKTKSQFVEIKYIARVRIQTPLTLT